LEIAALINQGINEGVYFGVVSLTRDRIAGPTALPSRIKFVQKYI
jgi:hypothetical protein